MVMVYMIWEVMPGNSIRIGIVNTKNTVFCGAVLGSSIQTSCVLLPATTTSPRIPPTTTVFVVCQDFLLRSSRLTLVHMRTWSYRFTTLRKSLECKMGNYPISDYIIAIVFFAVVIGGQSMHSGDSLIIYGGNSTGILREIL